MPDRLRGRGITEARRQGGLATDEARQSEGVYGTREELRRGTAISMLSTSPATRHARIPNLYTRTNSGLWKRSAWRGLMPSSTCLHWQRSWRTGQASDWLPSPSTRKSLHDGETKSGRSGESHDRRGSSRMKVWGSSGLPGESLSWSIATQVLVPPELSSPRGLSGLSRGRHHGCKASRDTPAAPPSFLSRRGPPPASPSSRAPSSESPPMQDSEHEEIINDAQAKSPFSPRAHLTQRPLFEVWC